MDILVHNDKFVCIEYPGVVVNNDKMLKTLGGESKISKIYSEPSRRLELRLRPDDVYCKCTHGDRFNTTNLLMKVTRRRKRKEPPEDSVISKVEIMGTVETSYKFRSLMDYQYLPMQRTPEGTYESLLPVLLASGMKLSSWLQEEPEAPVFVQPLLFSRFDQPSNYHFRKDPQHRDPSKSKVDQHPPNIIGRGRKRRTGYGIFLTFEDMPVPEHCTSESLKLLKGKKGEMKHLDKIKKAFEDRPVWSRNCLAMYLGLDTAQFKFLLPTVAYYFLTGPWRTFWVRFGYDPRKDPAAKIYQTLDIRIRLPPIPGVQFNYKRSIQLYSLPNKMSAPQGRIGTIEMETFTQSNQEEQNLSDMNMGVICRFRSGELPKHKQIFYQICDVEMDSVQELLHLNDGQEGTVCHEKDGWCLPNTLEKCRELILKDVKNTIDKIKQESQASTISSKEVCLEEGNETDSEDEDEEYEETAEYEEPETVDQNNT